MNISNRYYCIFIFMLLLSSFIYSQDNNTSQFKKPQMSPYEVYLEVQNDDNRLTEKTNQNWNNGTSTWENSGRSVYDYSYYNTVLAYYSLLYYYYYYYSSGAWNPSYYYYYYYNSLGYLSGYDYYGWYNNAWVLYGTGVYSNHNAWGEWGTETYTNTHSMSGRESSRTDRYYDNDGNVTDEYYSYLNGNNYENLSWTNTAWSNGYCDTKTYYDWNNDTNMWVYAWMYYYAYANGYNPQVYQSYGYLYGGSPTSWTAYNWYNGAWNPYRYCSYGFQNGYTSTATYYDTYNTATSSWANAYYQYLYSYYNSSGKLSAPMDISNSRLKLVENAVPGANVGEWDKTERTWLSYEDTDYKVGIRDENSLPTNFYLEQNYPNPFNPNTAIDFTLSEESIVKLTIYDLSGKLIKEIINVPMNAGNHSIIWDGKGADGVKVGAGMYLYNLQTTNFSQTKKMILLR